jgi:hypothetical protein
MFRLTPAQQHEAFQLYYEKHARLEAQAAAAAAAATKAELEMRTIPFISLCGVSEFKEEFPKCFDTPVSKVDDVKPGHKGSLGICYSIQESLEPILNGCDTEQGIANIKEKKYIYPASSDRAGKPLDIISIKNGIVPFYEFTTHDNPYFAIKKGATGLWLAKRTSGYSYNPNIRYPHRFSFEIVRPLTEDEADLEMAPGNAQFLVRRKAIEVPSN